MSDEQIATPSRERYWEEKTDQEKIETLAFKIEYFQRLLNDASNQLQRLETHVHIDDKMFFSNAAPVNFYGWPNGNILNRERPNNLLRGPY